MEPFFVYILECSDGSYYVGHTEDLQTRIAEHEDGTFGGYTARRQPIKLVYSCELPSREAAFARERQLKGWSREKKEALIRGDWDCLRRLARSRSSK